MIYIFKIKLKSTIRANRRELGYMTKGALILYTDES